MLSIDYPDYEIIVVDDGSSDKTLEIAKSFSPDRIKIIVSTGKGPSVARNIGVAKSTGEIVAFTDSDCIVDPCWLPELVRVFQMYPEASSVGGKQKVPAGATWFEKKVFEFMFSVGFMTDYVHSNIGGEIIAVGHNPSCCSAYRRNDFLMAGGFPENLWPGEDVELDYKISSKGGKILWNPAAIVFHHRPGNLSAFTRMMFRYGAAQGILVKMHGFNRKIQFLPIVSIFSFIAFGLGCRKNPSLSIFLSCLFFIFSLAFFRFDFFIWGLAIVAFFSWQIGFFLGVTKGMEK